MQRLLLSVVSSDNEPDDLRSRAAIALGPALEYGYIDGFEDPDDVPITEAMFSRIQDTFRQVFMADPTPKIVRRRILEASRDAFLLKMYWKKQKSFILITPIIRQDKWQHLLFLKKWWLLPKNTTL